MNKTFYKIISFLLKPFMKIFFPYEIKGKENIEKLPEGYIMCLNHLSAWDPLFIIASHPQPIYFMAKAEIFRNKLVGYIISKLGVFAVERGKGDKQAINRATEICSSGKNLGIFVEGTRSKTGEFLRPRSGAALLAMQTKTDILPVCITGTSKDNRVRIFKKTIISYGKILKAEEYFSNNESRSALKNSTNLIMESIKNLRGNDIEN